MSEQGRGRPKRAKIGLPSHPSPAPERRQAMNDRDYIFVDTPAALAAMLQDLQQHAIIAVDTESNNMFAYRDHVALIQFSTPEKDYIVDPLADIPVHELGPLFAHKKIEKVFHAAEYDLIGLRRDFGFRVEPIFDTMHAARLLGKSHVGLAALLEEYFGVHLDKRYQRTNWARRPLSSEQLAYAAMDTRYLIPLRERLRAELEARGLLPLALEDFARLTTPPEPNTQFDPEGFWRLPGVKDLPDESLAVIRALYLWREQEAERRDVPPFRVLHNRELVRIAQVLPTSTRDLRRHRDLRRLARGPYARHILRIVREARQGPVPHAPSRRPRPPKDYLRRYDALRAWRHHVAQAHGVDSDIILPKNALERIAAANPQTLDELRQLGVLGPERLRRFGEEIVHVLRREG